jgi:hypothetical protein
VVVVASEGAAEALIKAGEESDRLLSPSMARCRGCPLSLIIPLGRRETMD